MIFNNLHLHILQRGHNQTILPQVGEFLKFAIHTLEILQTGRKRAIKSSESAELDVLRSYLYEAQIHYLEHHTSLLAAMEIAGKAVCGTSSVYSRKRLAEEFCLLSLKASKQPKAKAFELPKFDSSILSVLGLYALAEESSDRDARLTYLNKAASIMVR